MKKIELHSDLMEKDDRGEKVSLKRIRKSVGWTEPIGGGWDVVTGNGEGMEVEKQVDAEILSILTQVHERIKRVEKQLENKG